MSSTDFNCGGFSSDGSLAIGGELQYRHSRAGVDRRASPASAIPQRCVSGLPLEIEGRKLKKARACSLWSRTRKHAPLSSIVQGGEK